MGGDDDGAYFAYGSNLSTAVMAERCPRAQAVGPARLTGWELCFRRPSARWGGHAADLRPAPEATTWGVLWWVEPDDWDLLDAYEAAYRRLDVVVTTGELTRSAATYVVADPVRDGRPAHQYRALMLAGAREHGLPEQWRRSLETLDALVS